MKFYICFFAVLLAGISCSASSDAERKAITEAAGRVLTPGTFAVFIVPPSTGPVNESVVSGLSVIGGPSRLVKNAAKTILECRNRKLDLAVAGKTRDKIRTTMLGAMKLLDRERIDGMTLFYMISRDPELQAATDRAGGKAVFLPKEQEVIVDARPQT